MMTATSDYLARLDVALRDVPHGVAAEIRAGIAEELSSLDRDAAERRIAQLGDPAVIAREAMDAGGYVSSARIAPPTPPRPVGVPMFVPVTRTRGFAFAAVLTLSLGGFILPFLGWVVGAVLVAMSSIWSKKEKVIAIVVPLVLLALFVPASIPAWMYVDGVLEPTDGVRSAFVIAAAVVLVASGLWLLWRMRGRTAAS